MPQPISKRARQLAERVVTESQFRRHAARFVGARQAEDAVQAAAQRLLEKPHLVELVEAAGSSDGYLAVLVRNIARNQRRTEHKHQRLARAAKRRSPRGDAAPPPSQRLDEEARRQELRQLLRELESRLTKAERRVFAAFRRKPPQSVFAVAACLKRSPDDIWKLLRKIQSKAPPELAPFLRGRPRKARGKR